MTLETHPVLHTAFILVCYVLGQWAGILGAAYASSKSTLNSIASIRQWFTVRWIPVGIRTLMALFAFFVLWENPTLFNLEKFMPNFAAHMGVAGFIGFASDQLVDKVMVILFPGVQKELPAIPPGDK